MDLHRRRFVQGELSKYKVYKKQLAEYELERRTIEENYPRTSYAEVRSSGQVSDPTFKAAARLERLEAANSQARFYVRAIDDVLECLPEDHQEIIRKRYFDDINHEIVADGLHIGKSTLFRYEREALALLCLRMGL